MKDVLGQGSRVMAAQDFRHTLQEEGKSVSNYIWGLERAFRIAHGSDEPYSESRNIFLFTHAIKLEARSNAKPNCVRCLAESYIAADKRISELRTQQQCKQQRKHANVNSLRSTEPEGFHSKAD